MDSVDRPKPQGKAAAFVARLAETNPSTAAFLADRIAGIELPDAPPSSAPPSSAPPVKPPSARPVSASARQHAHRPGPKPSRRRIVAQRRERVQRRESNHLAKLTANVRDRGGHGLGIRGVPMRVWVMCSQVIADPSGKAGRIHLRRMRNRTAAGAILTAAMERAGDEQTAAERARSWSDMRTRRIAALGLALATLAAPTRRRGPWGAIVIGIPRGAFAALLRDPFDARAKAKPAITTLFGTHRPGAAETSGQVGYFVALRAAGLVYRQQLPKHEASAYECWGPSGYATNRYWVATDEPHSIDDETARALAYALAELANVDAAQLAAQLRHERQGAAEAPPAPS
jgi:hypothetical protein